MTEHPGAEGAEASMPAESVSKFAGPAGYERLTVLGRGGTATVYSATRTADSMHVAIKVFDAPDSSAFERQRRATAQLDGIPGICPVLEESTLADGRGCLVFPFAAAGSLADRMDRFGTTDPQRVAQLGGMVARALGAAHAAGVLHRDVKPSNILLDGDDQPLLADFGAATTIEPTTASDTMAVTVMYAAPEVLEGAAADPRSDIYSLGLTLLALAIGRHPLGGEGDSGLAALINRICTDGVPDPGRLGLPDGLAAVLRQATELEPEDRYASAERLAAALDEVAARPDVAPSDSRRSRRSPLSRRAQVPMLLGVSIVTVLLVMLGIQLWSADDGNTQAELAKEEARAAAVERFGEPVTEANGVLGPLYEQSYADYVGLLDPGCAEGDRLVELSILAGPEDTEQGVSQPWDAMSGEESGAWLSYMPCDTGIDEARYILGSTGRWFVSVVRFEDELYQSISEQMRGNENSPSPDYTVNDEINAALEDPEAYAGWAIIDQEEQ